MATSKRSTYVIQMIGQVRVPLVIIAAVVSCGLMAVGNAPNVYAQATTISDRSLQLSSSGPGDISRYRIGITAPAVTTLGSIQVEFCANSPLPTEPCDPPAGFNVQSAVLADQTGDIGFTIHPSTTANVLVLSRTPSASSGSAASYELTGVVNANDVGTQYARYNTFASDDATGPLLDRGSIAYVINTGFGLATEVPPYLDFCVGTTIVSADCSQPVGDYVSLGDFSPSAARTGQIQMAIATNAGNGYSIRINGGTLASGNNALPALNVPTLSAPGTNQFGINLRSNSNPSSGQEPSGGSGGTPAASYNIPNRFTFRPNDLVASSNGVEDYRKYTVTYMVNISRDQPPGIYAGTYTYLALGNF